jgi:hypothetical protein
VAAHSTVRALFSAYNGPLYQVRRASDNTTLDIGVLSPGGFANAAAQDSFCAGTTCVITIIYDQSGHGNNLAYQGSGGAGGNDTPASATTESLPLSGNKVYSLYMKPGNSYWHDGSSSGMPTGSSPQGAYMVTSGTHVNSGCCFDYGNSETNRKAGGNGAMDAIYFGTSCWFGGCSGTGPWVQADLENGLFSGGSTSWNSNQRAFTNQYVTAMLKNNGTTQMALKGGNAQSGSLTTLYSGSLPSGYGPMIQQGAIVLGSGGDCCATNTNQSQGTFYEGAIVAGYPSDATDDAVQANIVAAGYGSGSNVTQPRAYWTFDQGSGTSAPDATNNGNNGTLQSGASWTTGKVGPYAVSLNGTSNSWVDVPTSAIDTSQSYSVSAWVKLNSVSGGNQTFASIDGNNISPFYLQLDSGQFWFTERSSDSTSASYTRVGGYNATAGTWYHVVGTYDNSAHTIALWVNGVLQGTASYSSPWKATGHTTIGRAKWNGSNVDFVNGAIDDVRMYSRVLDRQEIVALATVPAADFELDEGTGTQTFNFFANTTPGTLTGNATWTTGKVGPDALSLDGTSGTGVDIQAAAVDTSQSYSVAAWVNLNSVSGGNQTFAAICGSSICPFYLQLSGGKFTFTERSSDSTNSIATQITGLSPTTGTWYHVVGTYDNSAHTIALWVNGVSQGTASFSSPWKANGSTMIGHALWNTAPVDWTNGVIDDVHFYNRVLTSTEIGELAAG